MFLILSKHWNPKQEHGSKMFKGINTIKFQSLDSNINSNQEEHVEAARTNDLLVSTHQNVWKLSCDNLLKVGVELKWQHRLKQLACMWIYSLHYGDVWNLETSPSFFELRDSVHSTQWYSYCTWLHYQSIALLAVRSVGLQSFRHNPCYQFISQLLKLRTS